jgi:tetratricopeptide (TPR) repeat protein
MISEILYKTQGKLVEAEQMYQRALQGYEKAWGPEHTSTLDTVNNLANLYAAQGKLVEAEQMYQRALQGYEKAIGADSITTYIPALNTIQNLGSLFELQADFAKARIMYSKALAGYKAIGSNHPRCQSLEGFLQDLDTRTKTEAVKGTASNSSRVSDSDSKGAPSTSRRHKLFRKLGLK